MSVRNMVQETVQSGIAPLSLSFVPYRFFDSEKTLLRSRPVINSLEMGVLEYPQYRYVAARSKRGDDLVARHLEKLLSAYPALARAHTQLDAVCLPAFARTLLSGRLAELLFAAPVIDRARICVELSADLLYEDDAAVRTRLEELRALGVRIALFELDDPFCPVFRLAELPIDLAFSDAPVTAELTAAAAALPGLLHAFGAKVLAAGAEEALWPVLRTVGYDGYACPGGAGKEAPREEE